MRSHQATLHVTTGQPGHLIVQDDAVRKPTRQGIKELLTRGKNLNRKKRSAQHSRQRTAHRLFIIDDGDVGRRSHGAYFATAREVSVVDLRPTLAKRRSLR